MPTVDLNKKRVWRKKDNIPFGKYKGTSIGELLNTDPSYLVWAHNTIDWFDLDESVLEEAEQASGKSRQQKRNENPREVRTGVVNRTKSRTPDVDLSDTYDRFQPQDRGRFGDNERGDDDDTPF